MTRISCEATFRRLDDFADRALTPDEMPPARVYLEDCGACSPEDRFEAAVLQAVGDKLCRLAAPRVLVQRISQGGVRQCNAPGLGLVFGLNVLDGGGGQSGRSGYTLSRWALSRNEIRRFGLVVATNPYACGFFLWKYENEEAPYLANHGVLSARADAVRMAAHRSPVPCRIH